MSNLDNSDVQIPNKGVGGVYNSKNSLEELNLYLKNLQLMSEVSSSDKQLSISVDGQENKVAIKDLIPKESEFERIRKVVISNLNQKTDEELRQYQAKHEADNIFDLSSKIANFILDQKRKTSEFQKLASWFGGNLKPSQES